MWTTLALVSALSWTPAQAGQLELKNARVTYGILGQERKDTNYLPGDLVVLAFDIEGLKVAPDGLAKYSMSVKLYDHKQKKVVFEKVPQQMEVVNTLGGSRVPTFALTNIGTDTAAGKYTMTVEVNDGKVSKKLERDFEVKKSEFGIVRPGFVYNKLNEEQVGPTTTIAPPLAVPGQNLMLHFAVVGFALAGDKNDPNVKVEMKVVDEAGKPVLEKAFSGRATKIDDEAKQLRVIPFEVPIQVTRIGKFKV
ncbi:MAG: hypothetical protein ACRELF_07605, partial [Gemmataceae bacterium]